MFVHAHCPQRAQGGLCRNSFIPNLALLNLYYLIEYDMDRNCNIFQPSRLDLSLVFSTAQEISELSSSLERAFDYWTKNRWRKNDWHFFSFFQIMTNLRQCSSNFRLCRPSHRLEDRCVVRHISNMNFQSWDVLSTQGCRETKNKLP